MTAVTALRLLVWIAVMVWCGAGGALAGGWPRAKGELFVAAAHYANPGGGYSGVYLDYGVTARLGLGVDWGRSVTGKEKAVMFLRWPLRQGKMAAGLQLGAGIIDHRQVLRPGLSLGRSVTVQGRSGWIASDVLAEIGRDGAMDLKADITLGVTLSPRVIAMVQVQAGQPRHDPRFLRLVPSVLWRLKGGTQLEFGLTQDLMRGGTSGVKLGLWRTF